ncbi:MAG: Gx transporter family protein [Gammaproteobacteria bacterium]|nr:Gx transporter family protein [Gammaproteobacteria bacterium]MDH5692248.1 Gx transporter family protein [Gammaproteobacteria bacterium]
MLSVSVTREDRLIAGFASLAILVHLIEAAFPSPLPGVKPGLANIITLIVFFRYGLRMAVWVSLLRVLVASLLLGSFLSPTFALSLAGAVAVIGILSLISAFPSRFGLSPLGVAVLCALSHTSAQFLLAYWLLVPHPGLLGLYPIFMTFALIFGFISGVISQKVYRQLGAA